MTSQCIFCKIVNKEIPSKVFFEDEHTIAFHDINPQAPVHVLLIPKKHIPSLAEVRDSDREVYEKLFWNVPIIAKKLGIEEEGYRVVINTNRNAQQTVFHLHIHIIGGRIMTWPPG